jgi:hypothetical protein
LDCPRYTLWSKEPELACATQPAGGSRIAHDVRVMRAIRRTLLRRIVTYRGDMDFGGAGVATRWPLYISCARAKTPSRTAS